MLKDSILPLLKIPHEQLQVCSDNNTATITVPSGIHYLSYVLKDLPKGVFIDKQICGTGGTTLAIKSPSNYVIAVHRSLLVDNKYYAIISMSYLFLSCTETLKLFLCNVYNMSQQQRHVI